MATGIFSGQFLFLFLLLVSWAFHSVFSFVKFSWFRLFKFDIYFVVALCVSVLRSFALSQFDLTAYNTGCAKHRKKNCRPNRRSSNQIFSISKFSTVSVLSSMFSFYTIYTESLSEHRLIISQTHIHTQRAEQSRAERNEMISLVRWMIRKLVVCEPLAVVLLLLCVFLFRFRVFVRICCSFVVGYEFLAVAAAAIPFIIELNGFPSVDSGSLLAFLFYCCC